MTVTRSEYEKAVRAGQAAFRRELIAYDNATAERLKLAYERYLKRVAGQLAALETVADKGVTVSAAGRFTFGNDMINLWERRGLREDLQAVLGDFSGVMAQQAEQAERVGIRRGRQAGIETLEPIGVKFAQPSAQSIQAVAGYVEQPAFKGMVASYASRHVDLVGDIILSEASRGTNPRMTANHILRYVKVMPLVDALRVARTTQIYGAREGTRQVYLANQDIVKGWRWSAALDKRTCISCISQHGKTFKLDVPLNDHFNGRCAMIPINNLNRNEEVETGQAWFEGRPESEQRYIMGRARWQAWKDGEFSLDQITSRHSDPLFGDMYYAASLKELRKTAFERTAAIELFAPTATDFRQDMEAPYHIAKKITLSRMDALDFPSEATEEMVGSLYRMYRLNEMGQGEWDKEATQQEYYNLLYDIWKLGRDEPSYQELDSIRLRAGTTLSVYQQLGGGLSKKERAQLVELAFGDYAGAMDDIKDNRRAGRGGGGGRKRNNGFMSASDIDGANQLRENRMGQGGYLADLPAYHGGFELEDILF